jgi:hypothetical protein
MSGGAGQETLMEAIIAILIFVIAFCLLNLIEFGRVD